MSVITVIEGECFTMIDGMGGGWHRRWGESVG